MAVDLQALEKLSIKELRRQAALRNVPLTHISTAIEKKDLINLIICAGPVLDHYDVGSFAKVHSAESIATDERLGRRRKDKKQKKKKRKASASSSGSDSSRRRTKRSRSRKRDRRKKSRSPSVQIIPMIKNIDLTIPAAKRNETVFAIADTSAVSVPSAINAPVAKAKSSASSTAVAKAISKGSDPSLAQRGMAAAAALGYDVLPKAPAVPQAPAEGLRPSITTNKVSGAIAPGARVCVNYLTYGRCDMGDRCPEAHIIDPDEEMRVRARFKEQECNFGASCNRRDKCLYRHPGELMEEYKPTPAGQGVALRNNNNGGLSIVWQ